LTALPALRRPEAVKPILVLQAALLATIVALGVSALFAPSLVPPVPGLALAALCDGPRAIWTSWRAASWLGLGAVLYLGLVATVLAYAIWGHLLRRHPAALVAPFALLVPFVAAASSALVLGERFGPWRLLGMGLVLLGLAVIVLPAAARVTEPSPRSR
jgi:O-acetylserine/cysteine efflux transporter